MIVISIIMVSAIIYGAINEKQDKKGFKESTRFNQRWSDGFFGKKKNKR